MKQMSVVGQDLTTWFRALSTTTRLLLYQPPPVTAARQAAASLTAAEVKLHHAAGRLKAITPPAAVASEHAKLTKGVGVLALELAPIIVKLRQGYLHAADTVQSLRGGKTINMALTALIERGYRIPVGS